MSASDIPVSYVVNIKGDFTGKSWYGKFEAKTTLSHRDRLLRDRLRREYLGDKSEGASEEAKATAICFSELAARLTKWPDWWTASDMGMELKDMNLVGEVYRGALKIEEDYLKDLARKDEEAKKVLAEKAEEAPQQ